MVRGYVNLLTKFQEEYGIQMNGAEKELFVSIFEPRKLSSGDFFIRTGEKPDKIGLVVHGLFRSFYIDPQGNDHTKHFAVENWVIASYTAYITGKESNYSIEALEDSEILASSFSAFEKLAGNNYTLLLLLKKIVDKVLILKEEREGSFLLESGTERYLRFLNQYPSLDKRVKQYHLASYLGLTPVSLSRIRKKLQINK